MGMYINPPDMRKEEWLMKNARLLSGPYEAVAEDELPVVLVNNGPFTAAGIAYDAEELDSLAHPDPRPKTWWAAKKTDLAPFMR